MHDMHTRLCPTEWLTENAERARESLSPAAAAYAADLIAGHEPDDGMAVSPWQ